MPDQIPIELSEEAQAILRDLETMPQWMLETIADAMAEENEYTVSHIQKEYLSFAKDEAPVDIGLRVQSNRLRGSVHAEAPVIVNGGVESAIGSNVEYAAIHEFGGTIPEHDIVAKNGKALRFVIGGRVIYRKKVHVGERQMPARMPFQRGINDRLTDYSDALSGAIVKAWNENRN